MLEQIIRSHGIRLRGSTANLDATEQARDLTDLCEYLDGALTLDASLNFDQDGEMRYIGPSSGRLEFQAIFEGQDGAETETESSNPTHRSAHTRTRDEFYNSNRFLQTIMEDDAVDEELVSHLLDLYFIWENPWFPVVNEALFRSSWAEGGRYFSPLLLYCILASGSRFSDRPEVRSDPDDSNTAGKLFVEKAEILLHYDLKWPSITTIQSLAIMTTVYHSMGADAAGWLRQGMASRLALDTGMNIDPALLPGNVSLPPEEFNLRRQIYWALYFHDKLAASYTGRVCTLLDSQSIIKLPSYSNTVLSHSVGRCGPFERRTSTQLLIAMTSLCQIIEKVLQSLWALRPLMGDVQRSEFFTSCLLELKTWFYDLPSYLRIDKRNELPQVYTMHMVYHTAFILLAKPFIKNLPENSASSYPEVWSKAKELCQESAKATYLIAQKYRNEFGSFRLSPITATYCTLSAALALLDDIGSDSGERESNFHNTGVETCLKVLEELSTSWNPAKRIWSNLNRLYERARAKHGRTTEPDILGKVTIDPSSLDLSYFQGYEDIFGALSHDNVSESENIGPSFPSNALSSDYIMLSKTGELQYYGYSS
ncbi:phosphoesterase family protein [Lipomyces kononenkoae]|uniref:Phosphoesterase family protein n=1 Tax=Lipomyces kononenkoae TaxID=34357 RepID=A0ACC3T4M0_LIPKO